MQLDLTDAKLRAIRDAPPSGCRPVRFNAYHGPGERRYMPIAVRDDAPAEWRLTVGTPEAEIQDRFDAVASEGFAPILKIMD